jgi:4-hydroxythreonine-4-phosphate dehydrogenase
MSLSKPIIAITMGDAAGVGPEICLQALNHPDLLIHAIPIVYGDARILAQCARQTQLSMPKRIISEIEWTDLDLSNLTEPAILDLYSEVHSDFTPGHCNAATGAAAYRYIEKSIQDALAHKISAVVTAPINKEALHAAGHHQYPGHTEIFTALTDSKQSCMMQFSQPIRASFVTVHCGYAEVPKLLTSQRILEVIQLTHDAISKILNKSTIKLSVLGLNPHAGENGLFGNREEELIILPAIESARKLGLHIDGPLPPDTAFIPAKRQIYDAAVCMYHDQGHIPLKAIAFDEAVNITLGLPIIRTSVDHGTACDIAWQNKVNPSSLFQAFKLAAQLTH